MDSQTKDLIVDLGNAVRELRRQHELLTFMFDGLVTAVDELERQAEAESRRLRSVS